MQAQIPALTITALLAACGPALATEGTPAGKFEGKLDPFLGAPKLDIQQVFKGERFPNIVTAIDGAVLAVWGGVKVRRSEDGGKTWEPEIAIGKGYHKNLPDGPAYRGMKRRGSNFNGHFGMMGGLTRLPVATRDVLIYSNAGSIFCTKAAGEKWRASTWAGCYRAKRPATAKCRSGFRTQRDD